MPEIHPTAVVCEHAKLADSVRVGAYAVVEGDVEIGAHSCLESHSVVRSGSVLGKHVFVDSFAVVGGLPQDFKFDASLKTGVRIGDGSQLREHVTVHRSTRAGECTQVGQSVFLMAGAHIAHDCKVGDCAIIANNVLLAGEVEIGAYAFLGGGSVIHQFARIGESAMMSGNAVMSREVPPFVTVANRNTVYGLNLIGLKRRGFSSESIADIKACYKAVYLHDGVPHRLAAEALASGLPRTDQGQAFLAFFAGGRLKRFVHSRAQGGEDA